MHRGYIQERAKGSFTITIELPKDINNKRNRRYYTVKGTKKDAEIFLTEKLRELDIGALVNTRKLKYKDFLDIWKKRTFNNLEITTIETYKTLIEKYINKYLGNLYLEDIKPLHLQNFYEDLSQKHNLSNASIICIHRIIHSSLRKAIKWQYICRNVADCVEIPKAKKYNAKYLTDKEAEELLKIAKNTDIYIPVAISIYTGTRRGETLGLKWDNVNLQKGYIKIVNSLCVTEKGLILKQPKTNSGFRTIAISNTLIKILKKHKSNQLKNKLLLGEEYKDENFVCSYSDGTPFNPRRFSTKFRELLEENSLSKLRFHDLRHSHASLLVKLGVQPKEISTRLGHSNIGITMDLYSHIYEETDKEVADMFDNLIKVK